MLLQFENVGCKRCSSSETKVEILVPTKRLLILAAATTPTTEEFSAEISCNKCGKINRTKLAVTVR